jgi:serine/threonine protein kinase
LIFFALKKNGDLSRLIREYQEKERDISASKIFEWTLQASKGLNYLHAHQIIHRDIKPANMFLTSSNQIKLGDLAFAKLVEDSIRGSMSGKGGGSVVGSLEYMSPEMIKLDEYSFKTDIWSLGCVLYELVFLKKAFPNIFIERSIENLNFNGSIFTACLKK